MFGKLQKIVRSTQISLAIDTYDDIFSDFDPRPYQHRSISDDFIVEAKKIVKEAQSGKIVMTLLVPSHIRNKKIEKMTTRRIQQYFSMQHTHLSEKKRKLVHLGIRFIALGILCMIFTTFILYRYQEFNVWVTFLTTVFEPAGWFLFWEGLNVLIFNAKERDSEIEFNNKMASCKVVFQEY